MFRPKPAPLPPQWACLEGKVNYVQRVSNKEYSCSCPNCGGVPHENGEWPDRCRLFVDEHPTLFCRRCGLIAFPDMFGGEVSKPSDEQLEKWRMEALEREQEKKRRIEETIALLQKERFWERWHQEMGKDGERYWEWRGIPVDFQRYWMLGMVRDYEFQGKRVDCATIPVWYPGWTVNNIKLRATDKSMPVRYFYYASGIPAPLFYTDPSVKELGERVILVEGEIKAMVLFTRIADTMGTILGMPGTHFSESPDIFKGRDVTIVLDPESKDRVRWFVERMDKKRTRVLIPMMKIDDAINGHSLDAVSIRRWLRQAERLS